MRFFVSFILGIGIILAAGFLANAIQGETIHPAALLIISIGGSLATTIVTAILVND